MPNRFALTSPQTLGQPIVNGQNVLSTQHALSSSVLTHTGLALTSNLITVQSRFFGTLTNDCSLDIEVSIDGGTNYVKFASFTNAEIKTLIAKTIQVKATHVRAVLIPGTMTGANGVNVRYLD